MKVLSVWLGQEELTKVHGWHNIIYSSQELNSGEVLCKFNVSYSRSFTDYVDNTTSLEGGR